MAFEVGPVLDLAFFTANADLSAAANQYKIVKQVSATQVGLCTAASDVPYGILQNKPESGESALVRVLGVSKVRVNAAGLAINTDWGTDANGRAIAKVADKDLVGGRCVEAAGATEGLIATVFVQTLSPNRLSV